MRLPFSHSIRRAIRGVTEPLLVRMGILRAEPYFVICSRTEPVSVAIPKYTVEDFNRVLAAPDVLGNNRPKEWVYHCFVTRWASPFLARFQWMLPFKPKQFIYTSYKHRLEASIDISGKHHDEDFIRVNDEDILAWVKDTCRSTVYMCIICKRPDIGSDSVSLLMQFCDHKEAVAYKMVFG